MESITDIEIEDVRQSREYRRYMEKIGWKVEGRVFIRKLGPVSMAKIQRSDLPKEWKMILKNNQVLMCKLEPVNYESGIMNYGFRQDNWPLLATRTVRVDLRLSEEGLLQSFKKDTRYCIRQASNRKPQITINNFENFYGIWKKSAKRKKLWIPSEKGYKALVGSFGRKCFCLTVGDDSGAVILMHNKTAYYYYAGATKGGNEKNLPYLVVWEAMKEAKKRGCRIWDFEGIYDSRWPNKGWRGFSHFKRSFGGEEIEFPGCFTKWRWPL